MGSYLGGQPKNTGQQKKRQQNRPIQYEKSYGQYRNNPHFLKQFLDESPRFTANLESMFPGARDSYQEYLQMVEFLSEYDPYIVHHAKAKQLISVTTLLDRFFMICLNTHKYEQYAMMELNNKEIRTLFIDYMQLFIRDPQVDQQFISKLFAFIGLEGGEGEGATKVRKFAEELRNYLPHSQKYLKDYYASKFSRMLKDGRILRNFNSKVLREDAVLLAMRDSLLTGKQVTQLYSSETCGLSFFSLEKKIIGYTGPWLLLIDHVEKDSHGDKQSWKFGTLQYGPIRDVNGFQGNLQAYMFSIDPKIRFMTTDKGDNGTHYFYFNSVDEKVSKLRRGLGFGGTKYKEDFKLWVDEDLDKSTVFNGSDATYGFGPLASLSTEKLNIRVLEIWGLGTHFDLQSQNEYWREREEEALRRRKVNKKELIDGNVGMMFEKTFAHRDQVYGNIEKREEKE